MATETFEYTGSMEDAEAAFSGNIQVETLGKEPGKPLMYRVKWQETGEIIFVTPKVETLRLLLMFIGLGLRMARDIAKFEASMKLPDFQNYLSALEADGTPETETPAETPELQVQGGTTVSKKLLN